MDFERFQESPTGRLVKAVGGHPAFIPNPLPPEVLWTPALVYVLSEADRAVGHLAGLGQILPNPYLLIRPLQRQEAVLSSRIEGTRASLSELYVYERARATDRTRVTERARGDVREVYNYVQAMEHGLEQVRAGQPVTLDLVRELHGLLMQDVRGAWQQPGHFRKTQNWIGPEGSRLPSATYIPPPPERLDEVLEAWEAFLSMPSDLPPLVRLALAHYQFEAIHPFLDGNGRVGRLLMILLMVAWEILPEPLLYLSPYMERRRQMYYTLLLEVSRRGDWEAWLLYVLRGVAAQSQRAVTQGQRLLELRAAYHERYQSSVKMLALVDLLFENPVITGPMAVAQLDVSTATAYQYLATLEDDGILKEVTGRQRGRRYEAHEIMDAIGEQ
jgi:Fic family protein